MHKYKYTHSHNTCMHMVAPKTKEKKKKKKTHIELYSLAFFSLGYLNMISPFSLENQTWFGGLVAPIATYTWGGG